MFRRDAFRYGRVQMPAPDAQLYLDSIAANVRRLRMRLGWTQQDLEERTGFDIRFVQRIERGKVSMRVETLVRLAAALGVSPGVLLRRARLPRARPGRPRSADRS